MRLLSAGLLAAVGFGLLTWVAPTSAESVKNAGAESVKSATAAKTAVNHSAPYTRLLGPAALKAPVRFAQKPAQVKTPVQPVSQRAVYRPPLGYSAGYGGWYGGPRYTYYNGYGPNWSVYRPYTYSYQPWYGGWGGYPYYTAYYPGFGGYYAPYVNGYYYGGYYGGY